MRVIMGNDTLFSFFYLLRFPDHRSTTSSDDPWLCWVLNVGFYFFAFATYKNMGLALSITLMSSVKFITTSGILAAILFFRFHIQ